MNKIQSTGVHYKFQFPLKKVVSKLKGVYLLVDKHDGWVRSCGLQVFHGVPLVDAALIWSDAAIIVAYPGKGHSSREVVKSSGHLTNFVQHLQGWPRLLWIRKNTLDIPEHQQWNKQIDVFNHSVWLCAKSVQPAGGNKDSALLQSASLQHSL